MKLKALHLLCYLFFNILFVIITNNIQLEAKNTEKPKIQICFTKKNDGKIKRDMDACVPAVDIAEDVDYITTRVLLNSFYNRINDGRNDDEEEAPVGNNLFPLAPNATETVTIVDSLARPQENQILDSRHYWRIGRLRNNNPEDGDIYIIRNVRTNTVLEDADDVVTLRPEDFSRRNTRQQWVISEVNRNGVRLAAIINRNTLRILTSDEHRTITTETLLIDELFNIGRARNRHVFHIIRERDLRRYR